MLSMLAATQLYAQIQVTTNHSINAFDFPDVPLPATNDAATGAKFTLVAGRVDPNSRGLVALHDGRLPVDEDQPSENFFLTAGSQRGLLQIDLGESIAVQQVTSYSWHTSTRAAQVFTLYGASGEEKSLNHKLTLDSHPVEQGWTKIASVDSRNGRRPGGQHAVSITNTDKALGQFRYLLFDLSPTEIADAFGNTFFCEIDVIDAAGPRPERISLPKTNALTYASVDNKFQYSIDTTNAPELQDWTQTELVPVIQLWYPKIVKLLESPGYEAPTKVMFRYQEDRLMRGIPAYASRSTITMNQNWFRNELKREARGAVVHEMVHVVQGYPNGRRAGQQSVPGWIVEGIPDYIRWFLYEPETRGAQIRNRDLSKIHHDDSYRVSGNFLDYLTRKHDAAIVSKLNACVRQGKYSEFFWNDVLGKSATELEKEWKGELLEAPKP